VDTTTAYVRFHDQLNSDDVKQPGSRKWTITGSIREAAFFCVARKCHVAIARDLDLVQSNAKSPEAP
jgi:hypothetical protein